MTEYKEGTKFVVCGHEGLIERGWYYSNLAHWYSHDDYPESYIVKAMIEDYEGETLTVNSLNKNVSPKVWYFVDENMFFWPVATFLKDEEITGWRGICEGDTCIEGMTPLGGWFICKKCGFNLRTIK